MLNWFKEHKKGLIRGMFLVPILLVMIISISHVVSWYDLSNPMSWAIYLSIAIEIAAMSSIAAASVKVRGGVWFVFVIVTLIQFIGNIFFSYKDIDVNSQGFKDWVELTQPVFESLGSDTSDIIAQRRWLALLSGGLLPLISLASLHFFIKYGGIDDEVVVIKDEPKTDPPVEPIKPIEEQEEELMVDYVENTQPNTPVKETEVVQENVVETTPQVSQEEPILPLQPISVEEVIQLNLKKKAEGVDKWG